MLSKKVGGAMKAVSEACKHMIDGQLEPRAVLSESVLGAMANVPRESFVPEGWAHSAYLDEAMPVSHHRSMLPPAVAGHLLEAARLKPGEKVLLVGSVCGYMAALLHAMGMRVEVLEEHAEFASATRKNLQQFGYTGIEVHSGAMDRGWPQHAPYHCILTNGAVDALPANWRTQLDPISGRIVFLKGNYSRPGSNTLLCELMTARADGTLRAYGEQHYAPALMQQPPQEYFTL